MGSKELIFQIFSEFMAKVVILDELADVGRRLLAGFHQNLELIRHPPINKTSHSIEQFFQANKTKGLLAYVECGCVKLHDKVDSISQLHTFHSGLYDHLNKVKCIVEELEGLVLKMASEILNSETDPNSETDVASEEFDAEVINNEKPGVTCYGTMMSILFSMVKRDFEMQDKIISPLSIKTRSGELESYSSMLSLRPYINDEIRNQALRLIP